VSPLAQVSTLYGRPQNRLRALLPDDDFRRLRPHLKTVPLKPSQILHRQGDRLRDVYFPNGGVVSMATVLSDGSMVEAATVGDEGFVGVEASLSDDSTSACETIAGVNGSFTVFLHEHAVRPLP
jgi:CRP-like cAMP-binding protein